jgi:hypothetical protein
VALLRHERRDSRQIPVVVRAALVKTNRSRRNAELAAGSGGEVTWGLEAVIERPHGSP